MTVEQYSALPEPVGGRYELHHGELVFVTFPKMRHWKTQRRLIELLSGLASGNGIVGGEFAFRPQPQHELWAADVAYVTQSRYDAVDPDDYLRGSPELVIEVLSPSNTVSEMNDREAMCLENGCLEFWIVNPDRKTVKVSTPDRRSITYLESESIPLTVPLKAELPVADIFR